MGRGAGCALPGIRQFLYLSRKRDALATQQRFECRQPVLVIVVAVRGSIGAVDLGAERFGPFTPCKDAALMQRTRLGGSNTMVSDARTNFEPHLNGAGGKRPREE